jgi:hypothetical protein
MYAQKENFAYDFYGFVRGDVYGNSRSNIEVVDGLFYLFPKDVAADADGHDLNATPNGGFYTFTTRLGVNMKGPDIGAARTSANIESDFGGTTDIYFMLRLRRAYVKLDWKSGSSLLLGQTWHPLFGNVVPDILNLSTGAPFQPFNRSPQISYQLNRRALTLTASAIYQLTYTSVGPAGKSEKYLKDGLLPEFYAGADFRKGAFLAGAGVDMISLRPRVESVPGVESVSEGKRFRVNERVTSLSYELHASYAFDKLRVAGKTVLASNLTHTAMIGGFGVTRSDPRTGEREYAPFRHTTSWLNLVYGDKYQAGVFAGYTKNLGAGERLLSTEQLYGSGLNIDRLAHLSVFLRYVLPHWNIGLGYALSTAWYGTIDLADGTCFNAHKVANHRVESVFTYSF